jgi:phosphoglycolate phosphatase
MTHRIQSIVFDFDGTLAMLTLDFGDMKRRLGAMAFNYIDEFPQVDGMPALEWVEVLTRAVGDELGPDTGREFNTRCRFLIMDMELAAARRGDLFPFSRPMLTSLRQRGVKTGVVTRNCTAAVKLVFPEIESYCECLLAREDVSEVKPHPGHVHAALERIGVAPDRALMVGDHPMDVISGKRAGTLGAGLCSGRRQCAEFLRADADFVAPDCMELLRLLEREALLPTG